MVKSPGASPEQKKSKVKENPKEEATNSLNNRKVNKEDIEKFTKSLSNFKIPLENELINKDGCPFRIHPDENIENYFIASSVWGIPAIPWQIVKPVFLWKLEFVLQEFIKNDVKTEPPVEGNKTPEERPTTPVTERSPVVGSRPVQLQNKVIPVVFDINEAVDFIIEKAKSFDGFPFTWQRVCELLTKPNLHYNKSDKFVRAIDKVINVVTTISEFGKRSFGEWELPTEEDTDYFDNVIYGPVDEIDLLEKKNTVPKTEEDDEQPLDMSKKPKMSEEARDTSELGVEMKSEEADLEEKNEKPMETSSEENTDTQTF